MITSDVSKATQAAKTSIGFLKTQIDYFGDTEGQTLEISERLPPNHVRTQDRLTGSAAKDKSEMAFVCFFFFSFFIIN